MQASGGAIPLVVTVLLAAGLVALVLVAGSRGLDAPWMGGDEVIFIASNPDVTGEGLNAPLLDRLIAIFFRVHQDLYQPVPIASYALEWSLWGEQRVWGIRFTDVCLHACNALLLWSVLASLLAGGGSATAPPPRGLASPAYWLGYFAAALWALHPVLVGAWAGEMGRTHLLSAFFGLISLRLHLISLQPGRMWVFIPALTALALAMMSKPVVGWIGLIVAVEWVRIGLRRSLLSPRIYAVGALCVIFAIVTIQTTRATGLFEETEGALFGDRWTRSLLAIWLYVQNVFAPPSGLTSWHLPDFRTGWDYGPVRAGLAALAASLLVALLGGLSRHTRLVTVGVVWVWMLLLPVLGLVGGRQAAASDRYMYQPLMGVALALAALAAMLATRRTGGVRVVPLAVAAVATAAGIGFFWQITPPLCEEWRSFIQRAKRVVAQNPGDPRALEMLAAGYEAALVRETPEARQSPPPDFAALLRETLTAAANAARNAPQFFRDADDRAAFHRRISVRMHAWGDTDGALQQAQQAYELAPTAPYSLTRLAHMYRVVQRWDDARALYEQLETVLPDDPHYRALRLTEFGDLLANIYERYDLALPRYRAAYATGAAPPETTIGLARCEVLAGEGARGYELIRPVLQRDPGNIDAALILGMYYLRSHKFAEAAYVYERIIAAAPTHYPALIGYHEVCAHTGKWREALLAWSDALQKEPENRAFRSFLIWTMACANDPGTMAAAEKFLETDPANAFACYAIALMKARESRWLEATDFCREGSKGQPVPRARENARARATLRMMADRGELTPEFVFLEAILTAEAGDRAAARLMLQTYLEEFPESLWRDHALKIIEGELPESEDPPPADTPAAGEAPGGGA